MNIELSQVSYTYKLLGGVSGNGKPALKNVTLSFCEHEIVGVVGPSGSGKTTLVQVLNGLLEPDHGKVLIDGQPAVYRGEAHQLWQQKVGLVFQFPENQFFEGTVFDEIAFALRLRNRSEEKIESLVHKVAATLTIDSEEILHRSPFLLSEGQKRRVAIASILVLEPEILILDEPTAGLDYGGIELVKSLVRSLFDTRQMVVVVSHDMDLIAELCHRIIALQDGKVVFDGNKEKFFADQELLRRIHLEEPQVYKLAKRLKEKHSILRFPIFSRDELLQALKDADR